jgi:hypothetical protein
MGIRRGSVFNPLKPAGPAELALMRRINELHLVYPFMGRANAALATARRGPGRPLCWLRPHGASVAFNSGPAPAQQRRDRGQHAGLPQEHPVCLRHPISSVHAADVVIGSASFALCNLLAHVCLTADRVVA